MTKRFGVGFLVLGLAGVFVGSGGCALFTSTRAMPIGERALEGGYRVVLVEHGTLTPLEATKHLELRLTSEHVPQSHKTEVTPGVDRDYELRVLPGKWRAWVIGQDLGQAVLSVDFRTHEAWTDPAQQPDWATNN